jgi:hypothetical protein
VSAGSWLKGLACGGAVALAAPTSTFAALALAPGLLAAMMEGKVGQESARAALLCGAAAAVGPAFGVWQSGQDVAGAIAVAADPGVLGTCWVAQAAGWLLAQIAPLLIRIGLNAGAAARATLLRHERTRYEAEWGIPPANGPASEG